MIYEIDALYLYPRSRCFRFRLSPAGHSPYSTRSHSRVTVEFAVMY